MNHETDIACVVTNWNGGRRVLSCVSALDSSQGVAVHVIAFATGCCSMIAGEVFEKIGFPDEDFFFSMRWLLAARAYTFLRGEWKRGLAVVRGVANYHIGRFGGTCR